MSRRRMECTRCGTMRAKSRDADHECLVQWDTGLPAPWPIRSAQWLANRADVPVSYVEGLMNQGRLRGVKLTGESQARLPGAKMHYYFNRDDAEGLIERLRR